MESTCLNAQLFVTVINDSLDQLKNLPGFQPQKIGYLQFFQSLSSPWDNIPTFHWVKDHCWGWLENSDAFQPWCRMTRRKFPIFPEPGDDPREFDLKRSKCHFKVTQWGSESRTFRRNHLIICVELCSVAHRIPFLF